MLHIKPSDFTSAYAEPRVWYALTVRPGREQESADWLKRGSIHAYWPCYTRQVNSGRRAANGRHTSVARLSAVIPGYLFIAARPGRDPWDVVHRTPGIVGYIRDALGEAATLTNADIEAIRRIEGEMNMPRPKDHAHRFKVGHKVRVIDGVLAGWPVARISALAKNGQIIVEVALLGRVVAMKLGPHQIEMA